MRNNPTRDAHAAVSRAAILAAARELFVAHGYETVTIRQVAKAAKRSTGSLFSHWDGKDALFTEAMGRPHFTDAMGWRATQFWVQDAHDLSVQDAVDLVLDETVEATPTPREATPRRIGPDVYAGIIVK